MEKVLKLVLKNIWYDKIESGQKVHEYRECKPFWRKRLSPLDKYRYVEFQRAYVKNPPKMLFEIKSVTVREKGQLTDLKVNTPVFDIELGKRCR